MSERDWLSEATPSEQALAALWWDTGEFAEFFNTWFPAHRDAVRQLLWGDTKVRLARVCAPAEVRQLRRSIPADFSVGAVLAALPGSYEAPEWRGFAHTEAAFRDWHLVTHRATAEQIAEAFAGVPGVDWLYAVDAQGRRRHTHALVSFRFAHPREFVARFVPRRTRLAPTHSDFGQAVAYLDNQATHTVERGERPHRRIYIEGNLTELSYTDAIAAVEDGEVTTVVEHRRDNLVEEVALKRWMRYARRSPRVEHREEQPSARQATARASELADDYSGRWFTLEFREMLPGTYHSKAPPRWFGEEVVVLRNIPAELLGAQLSAGWLRSVPVVVYSVAAPDHPGSPQSQEPRDEPNQQTNPG